MTRTTLLFALLCLVLVSTASTRTWYITADGSGDAPTIQAGIDSAVAGDTVLVAGGTYYEHDIEMKNAVVLKGETGDPAGVTIDAQGLGRVINNINTWSSTRIEHLTITGGYTDGYGGGMLCGGSSIINNCIFYGNSSDIQGGGICCFECNPKGPTITNCIFLGNSAHCGGGLVIDSHSYDVVVAGCTFSGNSGPCCGGIYCHDSTVSVTNTIVCFSTQGLGIRCTMGGSVDLTCCDVYGNAGGDYSDCIAGQEGINGNFSACPSFCNSAGGDFRLCDESPCAPGNHPDGYDCGLIGAWPVGCSCGPSQLEGTTWGAIKAMYR